MFKIQKIILLLFLVCHYLVLGSLPSTEEELIYSTDINYGKWLEDGEVNDSMKNNWGNQREESAAYRAKAGRLLGQKPDGNILVAPFEGREMIVFRSSIYPLGHLYRAYDSKDLVDLLLGEDSSKNLKSTDNLHKQVSSLKTFVKHALKLYGVISNLNLTISNPRLSVSSTSKTKNLTKGSNKFNPTSQKEQKITEFDSTLQSIAITFTNLTNPPNEYNAYLPLLNNDFLNFKFDIKDKNIKDMDMDTKVNMLNNFKNILEKEYKNLHSSITTQLKEYVGKLIEYFTALGENKLSISMPGEECSISVKFLELCKTMLLECEEYESLDKGLKQLEQEANKNCALAHTEMMFRYYVCKNRLIPPENIYSYLDLCNKCEQMLAKDIGMYTGEMGFYAVSEIKFKSNTNYTTPGSLLKKYRLPPPPHIDSADTDSKTEEKT